MAQLWMQIEHPTLLGFDLTVRKIEAGDLDDLDVFLPTLRMLTLRLPDGTNPDDLEHLLLTFAAYQT